MQINRLDHLVLTVADINTSIQFYTVIMGMEEIQFGSNRVALGFGQQKINLHQLGKEFEPKAMQVAAGSADLCFILETPIQEALTELTTKGVEIIEGPVERTGAQGKIQSIYFRDPDGNLIELSNYA